MLENGSGGDGPKEGPSEAGWKIDADPEDNEEVYIADG